MNMHSTMQKRPVGPLVTRADLEATFRRTGPIVPPPQLTQADHMNRQREREQAARDLEQRRNRAQKPVDRDIPDDLDELVIGNGVEQYKSLREVERKLDTTMIRKKLDATDSVQSNQKHYGTLRLWISNTVENQPWQASGMDHEAFDFSSNVEATYRVKIEGRLLDTIDEDESLGKKESDQNDEPASKKPRLSASSSPRKKLSHFFKSIDIDFDRSTSLQPDGFTQVRWARPALQTDMAPENDFDCLQFERKSDENIKVNINLVRDETPMRYRLSQPLAELLDTEESDRKTVVMGIWEYVKMAGLQEDPESRRVRCDARLKSVRAYFVSMSVLC